MANTLKVKRSSSANATPSASDLAHGEIAMNVNDGKIFLKKSDNAIVAFANDTDNPPASEGTALALAIALG